MHKIKFLILTALSLVSILTTCYAAELSDSALDNIIEKVKADYGISLHYAEGPSAESIGFDYCLADAKDDQILKNAIFLFVQEISLYSKDFFRNAHFQDIYFVHKLFYNKKPVDGLFSQSTNYIFYDYFRGNSNTQKVRHNIHHEIYHMIGSKHPFWKEHDAAWKALNHAGFSYNEKYSPHEPNPINFYAPPEPGFITDYAMSSPEEDRAEVFACMMVPEELRVMNKWAQKDDSLFKKVEMMKQFLSESRDGIR